MPKRFVALLFCFQYFVTHVTSAIKKYIINDAYVKIKSEFINICTAFCTCLKQCFSTGGPRPSGGPPRSFGGPLNCFVRLKNVALYTIIIKLMKSKP
jgi:hypothetical protein